MKHSVSTIARLERYSRYHYQLVLVDYEIEGILDSYGITTTRIPNFLMVGFDDTADVKSIYIGFQIPYIHKPIDRIY